MSLLKKYSGIILVLLFAVLACLPLFQPGFYPMHDDEQIARLFDLNQALFEGQFPPRISPNLGFGYGYPFFNFYPSFAYYVGEVFHLFGAGYILSTKLMLFTAFFLSALFMYLLAKELFGKTAGIVAAAFYTFAPYRAVDVYARGAYAEFFSFVFLPLVFFAIFKLSKVPNGIYSVILAAALAGLILSHNLIFIMSFPFFIAWAAYGFFISERRKEFLLWVSVGIALGFGLSAYFWLPSYFERGFTLIRILTSELASYSLHFVCGHQLWNSPWGYGGSIPSCEDGLSFEVGKVHLIAAFAAVILFGYYLFTKKKRENMYVIPVFAAFLLFAMFFSVKYSKFIWDSIQILAYVQFPWRFLTLSVLFSSVLAGSIFLFIKDRKITTGVSIGLVLIVIILNLSYFKPQDNLAVTDKDYIGIEKIRWDTSSLAYEYVPSKIATKKSKDNTTKIDIVKSEIKKEPYEIIKGIMIVSPKKDLSTQKVFDVVSLTGGTLRINTFSFPGWQVYLDGKKVDFTDNNKLALIDVKVPIGKHTLKAVFEDTTFRKLGNFVSVISIIVACVIIFAHFKRHEKA